MSRIGHRFAAPFVILTLLTVACSDNQPAGPTNQGVTLDPQIGNLSSCSVAQDSVDAMLPQLFTPGSDRGKSVSTFNQMQKSLRKDNLAAAQQYMTQIVDLATKDFYANPSKITGGRTPHTAALLMDLIQGLNCIYTSNTSSTALVGFNVPLDGVVGVVTPGTLTTVAVVDAGGTKRAASQFDPNDLPPATTAVPFYLVTIKPTTTQLNTQLAQYGPFYEFSIEPALPASGFPNPVLTGVCINSTADDALNSRLRLAHDNEFGPIDTDDGNFRFGKIEIIGQAAAVDLSPLGLGCGIPAPVGFLRKAASYFLPAPLFAATSPATTGGKVKTYSPFGAVDPGTLDYGTAGWRYGVFPR